MEDWSHKPGKEDLLQKGSCDHVWVNRTEKLPTDNILVLDGHLLHFQNPAGLSRWEWSKSLVSQNVLKERGCFQLPIGWPFDLYRFVTQTPWSPPWMFRMEEQGKTVWNQILTFLGPPILVKAFERKVPCMVACAFPQVWRPWSKSWGMWKMTQHWKERYLCGMKESCT